MRPPPPGSPFSSPHPTLPGTAPMRRRVLAALPHRLTSSDSNGARRWGVSASVAWILFGFAVIFGAVVAIDEHDNAQMLWPAQVDPPPHETQDAQVTHAAREARLAQPSRREDTPDSRAAPHSPAQTMSSAALVDLLRQQLDTVRKENAADARRLTHGSHPDNQHAPVAPSVASTSTVATAPDTTHVPASAAAVPRKPEQPAIAKKPAPSQQPVAANPNRLPGSVVAPARPRARPVPPTAQSEALASIRPAASEPVRATAAPAVRPPPDTTGIAALPARTLPSNPAPAAEAPRIPEQPPAADTQTSQTLTAPSPASSIPTAPAALATPALAPVQTERGEEARPRPRPGCTAGSDSEECKETASPPDTSGSRTLPAGQTNEVWSGPVKPAPAGSGATGPLLEHTQTAQSPAKRIAKTHTPKQHVASSAANRAVRRAPERATERTEEHGPASSPLAMAKQTWHAVLNEIEPRERLKPARSAQLSESHTAIYRGH